MLPTIVTASRDVYSVTTVGKSKRVLDASCKSVFIVSEETNVMHAVLSTASIPVVKKPSVYVKLVDGGSATNAKTTLKTAVAARNISARDTIVSLIANLASFVTVERVRMSSGASIARRPVLNIVLVGDKRQQREQRHPNCFAVTIMRCERYRFIYILPSCFQCYLVR
mmetsp:Transcript_3428/g.6317  ORF Transcript_3428/g.6317 Transcript_3428/m.6317 type:complete len:168 (-) Transcript_3428:157-660(-)